MTAQFIAGNASNQYNSASSNAALVPIAAAVGSPNPGHLSQVLMVQGGNVAALALSTRHHRQAVRLHACPASRIRAIQPRRGWLEHPRQLGFDFASNTAYGPLIGHVGSRADVGNGLDRSGHPTGLTLYVKPGYVTWAGITAGKAQSFFSFIGGGDNYDNFFSPDRRASMSRCC